MYIKRLENKDQPRFQDLKQGECFLSAEGIVFIKTERARDLVGYINAVRLKDGVICKFDGCNFVRRLKACVQLGEER